MCTATQQQARVALPSLVSVHFNILKPLTTTQDTVVKQIILAFDLMPSATKIKFLLKNYKAKL